MITIEEAKQIVFQQVPVGPAVLAPISEVCGRVLAEEVVSPLDAPSFTASAMDGFALCHEETALASSKNPVCLKVMGVVAAGDVPRKGLGAMEAIRVMTGAMIPEGCSAVIPQEEVLQDRDGSILLTRPLEEGENIRPKGEEIKMGEVALPKNSVLTVGAVGFLASLGIQKVFVHAAPRLFILPTGSELVRDLSQWQVGKVMESNSCCLGAALQELSIRPTISDPIPDIPKVLHAVVETALNGQEMVILTGGVSVGAFDLVRDILKELGVQTLFWKVAQKPGKPLYFGRRGNTFVFGLPGNPASSLVCFYEYVRPAILKWLGFPEVFLEAEKGCLRDVYQSQAGRAQFVRAFAEKSGGEIWVTPIGGQESHKMRAFAKANCLMTIPSVTREWKAGDAVTIQWLPNTRGRGL